MTRKFSEIRLIKIYNAVSSQIGADRQITPKELTWAKELFEETCTEYHEIAVALLHNAISGLRLVVKENYPANGFGSHKRFDPHDEMSTGADKVARSSFIGNHQDLISAANGTGIETKLFTHGFSRNGVSGKVSHSEMDNFHFFFGQEVVEKAWELYFNGSAKNPHRDSVMEGRLDFRAGLVATMQALYVFGNTWRVRDVSSEGVLGHVKDYLMGDIVRIISDRMIEKINSQTLGRIITERDRFVVGYVLTPEQQMEAHPRIKLREYGISPKVLDSYLGFEGGSGIVWDSLDIFTSQNYAHKRSERNLTEVARAVKRYGWKAVHRLIINHGSSPFTVNDEYDFHIIGKAIVGFDKKVRYTGNPRALFANPALFTSLGRENLALLGIGRELKVAYQSGNVVLYKAREPKK